MADLSQLSDDDLKKLYADDFKSVSEEGVNALKTQQEELAKAEAAKAEAETQTAPKQQGPIAPPEFSDYSTLPTSAGQIVAGAQIPFQLAASHPAEAAGLVGLYKAGQVGNAYILGKQTEAEALKQRAAMQAQTQAAHQNIQQQKINAKINPVVPAGNVTPGPAVPQQILGPDGRPLQPQVAPMATQAEAEAARAAQAAKATQNAEQGMVNKIRNVAASKIAGIAEASPMLAGAGKMAGKVLPGAGLALGGVEAYNRAQQGDYLGAGLAGASGLVGLVPGIGTAASLGLTGINAGRDYQKYLEAKRQFEAQQKAMGR